MFGFKLPALRRPEPLGEALPAPTRPVTPALEPLEAIRKTTAEQRMNLKKVRDELNRDIQMLTDALRRAHGKMKKVQQDIADVDNVERNLKRQRLGEAAVEVPEVEVVSEPPRECSLCRNSFPHRELHCCSACSVGSEPGLMCDTCLKKTRETSNKCPFCRVTLNSVLRWDLVLRLPAVLPAASD